MRGRRRGKNDGVRWNFWFQAFIANQYARRGSPNPPCFKISPHSGSLCCTSELHTCHRFDQNACLLWYSDPSIPLKIKRQEKNWCSFVKKVHVGNRRVLDWGGRVRFWGFRPIRTVVSGRLKILTISGISSPGCFIPLPGGQVQTVGLYPLFHNVVWWAMFWRNVWQCLPDRRCLWYI